MRLDLSDNLVGLAPVTVGDQPARALWNPAAQDENNQPNRCADQERQPPAERGVDDVRIKQDGRATRRHGGANPKTSVDQKISPAAKACGNELLDGRVDGGVFAANAGTGEESKKDVAPRVPRQPRGSGGGEIDRKRNREEFFAAQPIREPPEAKCAKNGTAEIKAAGQPHLRACQAERGTLRQFAGQRAGESDF